MTQLDVSRCPFTNPERLFDDLADARRLGGDPRSDTYDARMVTNYDDVVSAHHDSYLADLIGRHPDHVEIWARDEHAEHFPLHNLFTGLPADGQVYGCGPESLLSGLEDEGVAHGCADRGHVERFAPRDVVWAPPTVLSRW